MDAMSARVTVISGPARSGKTRRVLDGYRRVLGENIPGAAVYLVPTWRAAEELRRRLLDGLDAGCFSPGVMTFEKFADAILEVAPEPIRPITRLMKRQLVRQAIDGQLAQGRLRHFGPIAHSSGLVDLVCEFIAELKRLEIWPEHFLEACQGRGITDKDAELWEIYDRYQQSLREHQLYDAEGRFWSARDLLGKDISPAESPPTGPFSRLRLVVADGFTDFTRTQHEILQILAGRVEELLITLPLEARPRRDDLFSKPRKTLAELRRRHGQLAVEELARPERPDWPAMAHLEEMLFVNPRHAQPAADTDGLEILAAARRLGEVELIGARIKRLLVEGAARPGEIAVVFRSLHEAGPLVGEVFDELGIPYTLETGQPLDRSPALAALVALLQLDADDWPFGGLLSVLGSNYFRPPWCEWEEGDLRIAVERTIRRLQIPRGRRRLLERLADRTCGNGAADSTVLATLQRLADTLDELPKRTTLGGWADAWERLARRTGLLAAIESEEGLPTLASPSRLSDRTAWARLIAALKEGDTVCRWLARQPPELDRREALAALKDTIAAERVGHGGDESGRVRVLSAASVRALRVPHLFVAGLSEKAFPPAEREDRLYGEAEYGRLIDQGLPLVSRTERNREEMLLFYEVLTRATRRLVLSYPALDESAQPLSPSPYLKEVEQACGAGRIRRTELTDLSPVPSGDEPLSATEFRVGAVAKAISGDASPLAGLIRLEPTVGLAENLLAGMHLILLRQDREHFGPAEGMLLSEAAGERLVERFSLEKTFHVTGLEQYASCPFRFFLERLLKLEPVEDLELSVDYLERGRLAHDVLASFHRRVNRFRGGPASPVALDEATYRRLLDETLEETCPAETAQSVRAALREVDRRLLLQWLDDYHRQHENYDKLWKECDAPLLPEFFEVSFGRTAGEEDPHSTDRPLELHTPEGTIRLAGRIDRIDTGLVAGQTVLNVLDYKTGGTVRFKREDVLKGTALQLPVYAIAAAELLLHDRRAVPWQAGYWNLRDEGFKPKCALSMYQRRDGGVTPDAEWEELRAGMIETVAGLVRGIRAGEFPVASGNKRCTSFCAYRTICRVNQIRSLEKTWPPATDQD